MFALFNLSYKKNPLPYLHGRDEGCVADTILSPFTFPFIAERNNTPRIQKETRWQHSFYLPCHK